MQKDPCEFDTVPHVEMLSVAHGLLEIEGLLPNFTDLLNGTNLPGLFVPHIAIRGTVQPNTTRCELYSAILGNFASPVPGLEQDGFYYCFVDATVNEYIVGTGPPTLTIVMHREIIWPIDAYDWSEVADEWIYYSLDDPRARTAAAYEGRELVMLLSPATSIAVEAWTSRGRFRRWVVQRNDDSEIRAVAEEISFVEDAVQRSHLDVALVDLIADIKAAAAARTAGLAAASESDSDAVTRSDSAESSTMTTTAAGVMRPAGGVGDSDPLPLLIVDANRLRDFYVEVGATYEGDDATTVLPPPKPPPPGVPTNIGMSVEDGVVLVTWDEPESGGDVEEYRVWLLSELADGGTKSFYNVASYQGERFFEITYMVGLFGDEFSVQVRAANRVGFSPWTEKRFFTTPSSSSG